jgi:uncharacterized protein YbcI
VPGSTDAVKGLHSAINDLVVRALQDYTGRGAMRARTVLGADTVMVLLEDTLTRGERTLLEHGRTDEVLALRRTFQEVMGGELRAGVEALTGRRVVAFMSANHVEPDLAAEIFVLGDALPQADGPDTPSVGPREQVG